jgi:hypothetical protein
MSVTNRDASFLTRLRQGNTLRAYYTNLRAAQNAGTTVRVEQPNTQLEAVITNRREQPCGLCSGNVYSFPPTNAPNASS